MTHEEVKKHVEYLANWAKECASIYINITDTENAVYDYLAKQSATIRECIALLCISGENTKQAVIDKLRGCVE